MLFDIFSFLGFPIPPLNFYSSLSSIVFCFAVGFAFGSLIDFWSSPGVGWKVVYHLFYKYEKIVNIYEDVNKDKEYIYLMQLLYKIGVFLFLISFLLDIFSFYIGE